VNTKTEERRAACAAVDFMWTYPGAGRDPDDNDRARADATARRLGMRPLKPPPVRFAAPTRTAGAAELASEIRRGAYNPDGPRFA
jgi:hypothetical protein